MGEEEEEQRRFGNFSFSFLIFCSLYRHLSIRDTKIEEISIPAGVGWHSQNMSKWDGILPEVE